MVRTASQIFEGELSGEPLTQESVIEAIKIAQIEILEDVIYNHRHNSVFEVTLQILQLIDKIKKEIE